MKPDSSPDAATTQDRGITFVFGSARGGTTYLTDFLDQWFDYGMGPEGTFIKPRYEKRQRYGDLADPANMRRLAEDICSSEMMRIMRETWPEPERIDVTPEAILKHVDGGSFADAIYAAFAAVADLRGKVHIGSKDPSFWAYWPILDELFGKRARYLCIVRDGRDVALSTYRMAWGEQSAYLVAKRWVEYLEAIEAMKAALAPDQVHVIRYETFLTNPEQAIAFLEESTQVTLSDSTRDGAVRAIRENSFSGNFNKWKDQMSERDIRVFEGVAETWLQHYQYDLSGSKLTPGVVEKAQIYGKDFLRKVSLTVSRISNPL